MPFLEIETNIKRENIPSTFLGETIDLLAQLTGIPKQLFSVRIHPDQMMVWGEVATDSCAVGRMTAILGLGPEENKIYSAALMAKLSKDLGIPSNRVYIFFESVKQQDVGHENTTFADAKFAHLFAKQQ